MGCSLGQESAGIYGEVEVRKRTGFAILFMLLLATEILIGMYATGWVRNYLLFAFLVEFLQLWGFCDRFGITNRLLRIIIGTGFSLIDILSYTIGIIPCYMIDHFVMVRMKKREDRMCMEGS